jgi:predicted metal-dependent hydrolase
LKKLLRQLLPEPLQLALQLDFFTPESNQARPNTAAPVPGSSSGAPGAGSSSLAPSPLPAPPAGKPPAGMRRLQLREHCLDYSLRRSKRRSIGFLIDDEGLHVAAPRWVTVAEVEVAIREKQRWIFAKLAERRERVARMRPPMEWREGALFPYLGRELTLRIGGGQAQSVQHDEDASELLVCLPGEASEQQLKDVVLGWLQREARALYGQRLPIYAEKLGVQYKSFTLSSAQTQWGSCTQDGRIRLNWRLMHFGLQQIDYVIAHELAHLREMNHSPRFWATVQAVFPEFEAARRALREHPPGSLPAF